MRKHAFTLIELLIVLVIIGILAVLAIPQYAKYVNKINATTEMARLLKAIATLKATTGCYPMWNNIDSLEKWKSPKAGLVDTDGAYPNWCGPYIEDKDDNFLDLWGRPYYYDGNPDVMEEWCPPGGVSICSAGPDGHIEYDFNLPPETGTLNNPNRQAQGDDIAIYCN